MYEEASKHNATKVEEAEVHLRITAGATSFDGKCPTEEPLD